MTAVFINEAIEELRTGFRGELIHPGSANYEEARKVYNAMIDKKPRLIAKCVDVADVIAAADHVDLRRVGGGLLRGGSARDGEQAGEDEKSDVHSAISAIGMISTRLAQGRGMRGGPQDSWCERWIRGVGRARGGSRSAMSAGKTSALCPTCRRPSIKQGNKVFPFCSERCQLVDLGHRPGQLLVARFAVGARYLQQAHGGGQRFVPREAALAQIGLDPIAQGAPG